MTAPEAPPIAAPRSVAVQPATSATAPNANRMFLIYLLLECRMPSLTRHCTKGSNRASAGFAAAGPEKKMRPAGMGYPAGRVARDARSVRSAATDGQRRLAVIPSWLGHLDQSHGDHIVEELD